MHTVRDTWWTPSGTAKTDWTRTRDMLTLPNGALICGRALPTGCFTCPPMTSIIHEFHEDSHLLVLAVLTY